MNYKLKREIIFSIFCLLMLSCSSDDNSNLILKEFIEPNLNFGISNVEFLNQESVPNEITGTANYYNSNIDGVINYIYMLSPINGNIDSIYYHSIVNIYENEENLDYILNWLTKKYGEPEYHSVNNNTVNWYQFKNTNNQTYDVTLYVPGDGGILIVGSNDDIRLSSRIVVDYLYNP